MPWTSTSEKRSAMPPTDPTLAWVLQRAATPEAQHRVAVFDALSAAFRVEAAGVDVTPARRAPALEPELVRLKKRRKR